MQANDYQLSLPLFVPMGQVVKDVLFRIVGINLLFRKKEIFIEFQNDRLYIQQVSKLPILHAIATFAKYVAANIDYHNFSCLLHAAW